MTIIASTYFGERITIRNTTKDEAIQRLEDHGVPKDWIYKLEVQDDAITA
jgi:hypothetical protein